MKRTVLLLRRISVTGENCGDFRRTLRGRALWLLTGIGIPLSVFAGVAYPAIGWLAGVPLALLMGSLWWPETLDDRVRRYSQTHGFEKSPPSHRRQS